MVVGDMRLYLDGLFTHVTHSDKGLRSRHCTKQASNVNQLLPITFERL